ncbi:MAG: head decoration protein [Desulfovibrionaceae bacterium]
MTFTSNLFVEGPRLSDFILMEVHPSWCRETRTLAPTTVVLPVGTVLAPNGKGALVPYMTNLEGATQANVATCVLIQNMEINTQPQDAVVLMRGCVLAKAPLHFSTGVTDTEIKTALAALNALGIVCEE